MADIRIGLFDLFEGIVCTTCRSTRWLVVEGDTPDSYALLCFNDDCPEIRDIPPELTITGKTVQDFSKHEPPSEANPAIPS